MCRNTMGDAFGMDYNPDDIDQINMIDDIDQIDVNELLYGQRM